MGGAPERELKIVVSAALDDQLQRIKGLIAHAKPDASYAELLQYLADAQLKRLEKEKGIQGEPVQAVTSAAKGTARQALPAGKRVYLPAALRKAVWARSGGQCELVQEGRRCSARQYLQLDHVIPLALGGANDLSNLRLACAVHNAQQARLKLGTRAEGWKQGRASAWRSGHVDLSSKQFELKRS